MIKMLILLFVMLSINFIAFADEGVPLADFNADFTDDELNIYQCILEPYGQFTGRPIIILSQTYTCDDGHMNYCEQLEKYKPDWDELTLDIIDNFQKINKTSYLIPANIPFKTSRYYILTENDLEQYHGEDFMETDTNLRKDYPGIVGIYYRISRVGFNSSRNKALILFRIPTMMGLYFLSKNNSGWDITDRKILVHS